MTFDLDLWPSTAWTYEGFPDYINKPSLVQIGLQLFKWSHCHIFNLSNNLTSDDLWPWYMTFDCMNIWRFTYYINKPSLVQIGLSTFQMRPFSHFQPILYLTSDELWPWYMTSDLINKWGFPCCIYDPTLVEIHQSMWKTEPNVSPFFTTDNNRQQQQQWTKWSICVFPAKTGNTKSALSSSEINFHTF